MVPKLLINRHTRTAIEVPPDSPSSRVDPVGTVSQGAHSPNLRWRDPTPEERGWALDLAHHLETPQTLSDPVRRSYTTPPGRLRALQAVQGAAHESMGMLDSSRPWRRAVRARRAPEPLCLGILTDISGSQRHVVEVSTSLTWILHTAGFDGGVEVASLLFGQSVTALCQSDEIMPGVPEPITLARTEAFDDACLSLHRLLGLDDRTRHRVVVIFSDGGFTPEEDGHRQRWLDAWARAGVRVLWVSDDVEILGKLPETVDSRTLWAGDRAKVDIVTHVTDLLGKGYRG